MTIKYRTAKDFSRKTDAQVLATGRKVEHDLAANPDLPTPVPALSVLTPALNEYEVSISNASYGGTHLIAIRKEKRAVVIDILQKLGIYVDLNGQNTESIMLSSGFEVYSTAKSVAPASETPIILSGKDGSLSGDAIIRSRKMANAILNQIRYTTDPFGHEATWTELPPQTKATFYLTGLTPAGYFGFKPAPTARKDIANGLIPSSLWFGRN